MHTLNPQRVIKNTLRGCVVGAAVTARVLGYSNFRPTGWPACFGICPWQSARQSVQRPGFRPDFPVLWSNTSFLFKSHDDISFLMLIKTD